MKGKQRPKEERALAVALAEVCENNNEAARLLDWPASTVRLYRQQAEKDPEFARLCLERRAGLGARMQDLSWAATERLKDRIEQDRLDNRELITLMGVGFQRSDTALNLEQPREVHVVTDAGALLERLRATIAAAEAALPSGDVVEAEFTVNEGE